MTRFSLSFSTFLPSSHSNKRMHSTSEYYLSKHKLLPEFLSKYTLTSDLGVGGFGFVCSATQLSTQTSVAVKFILKHKIPAQGWARDPEYGAIPLECYFVKRIHHPNIIGFLEYFEDTVFAYMVTELHGSPWNTTPLQLLTPTSPGIPLATHNNTNTIHTTNTNNNNMSNKHKLINTHPKNNNENNPTKHAFPIKRVVLAPTTSTNNTTHKPKRNLMQQPKGIQLTTTSPPRSPETTKSEYLSAVPMLRSSSSCDLFE